MVAVMENITTGLSITNWYPAQQPAPASEMEVPPRTRTEGAVGRLGRRRKGSGAGRTVGPVVFTNEELLEMRATFQKLERDGHDPKHFGCKSWDEFWKRYKDPGVQADD